MSDNTVKSPCSRSRNLSEILKEEIGDGFVVWSEDGNIIKNVYVVKNYSISCDLTVKQISKCLKSSFKFILDDKNSLIALQGPKAAEILEKIFPKIKDLKFMQGGDFLINNKQTYITRSGYTGEDGFEISIPNNEVESLIDFFIKNKVKPVGLGARNTLRLEAGLCLYGNDLNENINPIEANLKWAIAKKRREEGGFNGWEKIKNNIEKGTSKLRVGILPEGKIIAREGTKIFSSEDREIGTITSGTFGPSVNAPVAMGYVNSDFSKIGTVIKLEVRGKKHEAKIAELPFYKKSYAK